MMMRALELSIRQNEPMTNWNRNGKMIGPILRISFKNGCLIFSFCVSEGIQFSKGQRYCLDRIMALDPSTTPDADSEMPPSSSSSSPSSSVLRFTPTSDVCDALGVQARVPDHMEWRSYGAVQQFCGVVVTVQCHDDNSWVKHTLEQEDNEGSGGASTTMIPRVLVVDGGGSTRSALLGDQLAAAAIRNHWAGVIVHGCVRDVAALAKLPLGVLASRGCVPRKSNRGTVPTGTCQTTLSLGGVPVSPGDWVFADLDGVVFVSPSDWSRVDA
jgi:regulator of ribonuclease activity A